MNPRLKERYEIAFGLRPRSELKSWEARYNTRGGSFYKAVAGGKAIIGSAAKSYTAPAAPPLKAFHEIVTNYARHNATVDIASTGRDLSAGGSPVVAIKAAGVDRYGGDLAELTTQDGRVYRVARSVLKRN